MTAPATSTQMTALAGAGSRGRAPAGFAGAGAAIEICGTGADALSRPMNRAAITTRTAAAARYAIRCRRSGSSTSAKLGRSASQQGYACNEWALADLEPAQPFRLLLVHLDVLDIRVPRPR